MKFKDIIIAEEKVRLDPKCWTGKKIGNPKTKVKGGVRVNNCVPAESVEESVFAPKGPRGFNPETANFIITMDGRPYMTVTGHSKAMEAVKILAAQQSNHKWSVQSDKKSAVAEAANPAQQAAIAINMKKHHQKPKGVAEGSETPEKEIERLKLRQNAEHGGASLKRQAETQARIRELEKAQKKQGMAEDFNGEYDDEAGMADNNLETLRRAVDGIDDVINTGDNLPEWCQEKIAVAKSMLVSVWDYMRSEEEIADPEIEEMYEAMDQLAEEMAAKKGISADLVWESFEALDDHMLYETAAWRRKEGKSAKGGLNAKGVASYRRENPGSKLQTAVTTKPSKLKPGSKAAKRRKSFCARMGGVKGPMKKPNGKPTRKALALRKWNC
jgi:hypothetical protein